MNCGNAESGVLIYTSGMGRPRKAEQADHWPKRGRFVELLDAKLAGGATYEEIATALGLASTRSLEQEFRTKRRPGRGTLELAAVYFDVDVWELDGPLVDDDFTNQMRIYSSGLSEETKAAIVALAKAGQIKGQDRVDAEGAPPQIVPMDLPGQHNRLLAKHWKELDQPISEAPKVPKTKIIYVPTSSGKASVMDLSFGSGTFLVDVLRGLQEKHAQWVVNITEDDMKVEEVIVGPKGKETTRPVHPDPQETRMLMEIWEKQKPKLMQFQDDQAKREGLVLVKKGKSGKG